MMADLQLRTSELARLCGVKASRLKRWARIGDIPHAPLGMSGAGRGNEKLWPLDAIAEAVERSRDARHKPGPKSRLQDV